MYPTLKSHLHFVPFPFKDKTISTHMHVCMSVRAHAHTYRHTHMHTHMNTRMHTYTHIMAGKKLGAPCWAQNSKVFSFPLPI